MQTQTEENPLHQGYINYWKEGVLKTHHFHSKTKKNIRRLIRRFQTDKLTYIGIQKRIMTDDDMKRVKKEWIG